MPLVRIVANAGQNTDDLARDLRDRGFEVEIASTQAASSAADFEIHFEECSADEVMGRLLSLAEKEDLTICLSPGTIPAAEDATVAIVDNSNQRVGSEQRSVSEPPLTATTEPSPSLQSPTAEPVPEVVEQNVFQAAPENDSEQRTLAEALSEPVYQEGVIVSQPEPVIQRETNEVWFQEAEPSRQSQSDFQSESQPPALRDADELEFQEVAAMESSNEGLSDWPIWQSGEEELPVAAMPSSNANRSFAIQLAKLRATGTELWAGTRTWLSRTASAGIFRNDKVFNRVATAISATAILLLLYGATAHRFHPLSSTILRGSQPAQAAPFQKKDALPSNPATNAAEPGGTTPATASDVALSETAASPIKPLALRAKMPTQSSADGDGDYVAKDTVVRYTTRRRKRVPASEVRDPGIKYYTDLKNTR